MRSIHANIVLFWIILLVIALPSWNSPTAAQTETTPANWTVLVYMAADNLLEKYAIADINEMELAGSAPEVTIVAQLDRAEGFDATNGDWVDARRLLIHPDADPNLINPEIVEELGETNTGDPATLADFILWGMQTYPAEHYALIMWDHGSAWTGTAIDDSAYGDGLTLAELRSALQTVVDSGVTQPLDLIGFDACMMGSFEVYSTVAPYARYSVASPELIPSEGWDYQGFLAALIADPSMDAETLGRAIVDTFYTYYTEVITQHRFFNLAVIDLSQTAALLAALADFSAAITTNPEDGFSILAEARRNALVYAAHFGSRNAVSAVDLTSLMQLVAEASAIPAITTAAEAVISRQADLVRYYRYSEEARFYTGLSIYFPRTQLWYRADPGYDRYVAEMPADLENWSGLLNQVYAITTDTAPTSELMDWGTAPGNQAFFDLAFNAAGLAQAFFYTLYPVDDGPPILVDYADMPVEAGAEVMQVGHTVTWARQIPLLADGSTLVPVLVIANPDNPTQGAVTGRYLPQDNSAPVEMVIIFDLATRRASEFWEKLTSPLGVMFAEIDPQPGDHFEPLWYSLTADNELAARPSGQPLLFVDEPFALNWIAAPEGEYQVGVASENLNGTAQQTSVTATVAEDGAVTLPPSPVTLLAWIGNGAAPGEQTTSDPGQIVYITEAGIQPLFDLPPGATRVLPCTESATSPNRRYFTFFAGGESGALYLVDRAGSPVEIAQNIHALGCLGLGTFQYSPDSRRFGYIDYTIDIMTETRATGWLYVQNTATREMIYTTDQAISFGDQNVLAFDLSDDAIAYAALYAVTREIAIFYQTVKFPVEVGTLTAQDGCVFRSAQLDFVNADQIVVVTGSDCSGIARWAVYRVTISERRTDLVLTGDAGGGYFATSRSNAALLAPDGQTLYFAYPDGFDQDSAQLQTTTLDGLTTTPLFRNALMPQLTPDSYARTVNTAPVLSADGRWLAMVSNTPDDAATLQVIDLSAPDLPPIQLAARNRGETISALAFTPDNRELLAVIGGNDANPNSLFALNLDTTAERRIVRGRFGTQLLVSPSGRRAALPGWQLVHTPHQPNNYLTLVLVDLASQRAVPSPIFVGAEVVDAVVSNRRFLYLLSWRG